MLESDEPAAAVSGIPISWDNEEDEEEETDSVDFQPTGHIPANNRCTRGTQYSGKPHHRSLGTKL